MMRNKQAVAAIFIFAAPLFCMAQADRIETSRDGIFLGELMLSEKRYPEADACFKKALSLTHRDSFRLRIATKMLDVYTGLKDVKALEDCYARLLPKMSDTNKVLLTARYATNLLKLKEAEKAREVIAKSSFKGDMSNKVKAKMYYDTAQVYRRMKQYKKAGELFLKAGELATTPKSKASYYGAICYFPKDKELDVYKQKAADWYFKQKGLVAYKGLATRALVTMHNRDKEFDESIELLKNFLKEDLPHKGGVYYQLARILESKGECEQAVEYYEKALSDKKFGDYNRKAAKRSIKKLTKKIADQKK